MLDQLSVTEIVAKNCGNGKLMNLEKKILYSYNRFYCSWQKNALQMEYFILKFGLKISGRVVR
jgi:hypothetical protein